jgi:hypothetical protein
MYWVSLQTVPETTQQFTYVGHVKTPMKLLDAFYNSISAVSYDGHVLSTYITLVTIL